MLGYGDNIYDYLDAVFGAILMLALVTFPVILSFVKHQ